MNIRLRLACEKEHELHISPMLGEEDLFKDVRMTLIVGADGRQIELRGSRTEGNKLAHHSRTEPKNWEYEYIFKGVTPFIRFSRFEAEFKLLDGDVLTYEMPEPHLLPWPKTVRGHEGDSARLLLETKVSSARHVGYDVRELIKTIPDWFKSHITSEEWRHIFAKELNDAHNDRS